MRTKVTKWGHSLGIRIPRSIADQLNISEGTSIELIVKNNDLLIHKIQTLSSLIAQITPENMHSEIDTGPSTGGETW